MQLNHCWTLSIRALSSSCRVKSRYIHNWTSGWRGTVYIIFVFQTCSSVYAFLGFGSIISGIIGGSELQELCWHNRHTFLIRWPEHCKLISFDQVHWFPVTSLQQESFFFWGHESLDFFCSVVPPFCFSSSLKNIHALGLSVMLEYNHWERWES